MERDKRDSALQVLDILTGFASEIYSTGVASEQRMLDREYEKEIREDERKWQLNSMLLQDSRNKYLEAQSKLSQKEEEYFEITGKFPEASSEIISIIDSSYSEDMNDLESAMQKYDNEAILYEKEADRLASQIVSANIEAKEQYAIRFPEYVDLNVPDQILDPIELGMLTDDITKETNEANIKQLVDKISALEGGDRASRTNNPGAMLYKPWQDKYGASKNEDNAFWQYRDKDGNLVEAFSEDDIPEGVKSKKLYTSEFPDKESGEAALTALIKDHWNKAEGDIDRFTRAYTGLDPDTPEFASYSKAIKSLDFFESPELVTGIIKRNYYETPPEGRIAAGEQIRMSKAKSEEDNASLAYDMLSGITLNPDDESFLDLFGEKNTSARTFVEVAFSQPSAAAFHAYLKQNPEIEGFIMDRVNKVESPAIEKFKSFFNQTMDSMDKVMTYRFPNQAEDLDLNIENLILESGSIDQAVIDFMSLTQGSGLSSERRSALYDQFQAFIVNKYGESARKELNIILKRFENGEDDDNQLIQEYKKIEVQKTLDSLENLTNKNYSALNYNNYRIGKKPIE